MQIRLFAVGEGARDRILAGNGISLNANLAKCREGVKAGRVRKKEPELGTERKKRYRKPQKAGSPDGALLWIKLSSPKAPAPPNETYAELAIPEKSGMMNKKELKS